MTQLIQVYQTFLFKSSSTITALYCFISSPSLPPSLPPLSHTFCLPLLPLLLSLFSLTIYIPLIGFSSCPIISQPPTFTPSHTATMAAVPYDLFITASSHHAIHHSVPASCEQTSWACYMQMDPVQYPLSTPHTTNIDLLGIEVA